MSFHYKTIEHRRDAELREHLAAAGVSCRQLTGEEHGNCETAWRAIYGGAFRGRTKRRHDAKAFHAFLSESASSWLLIPFLSPVAGTPVNPHGLKLSAFACAGPLQELAKFTDVEFFISPHDLAWTFVRTHEDFAWGGPYFVRQEWLPDPLPLST